MFIKIYFRLWLRLQVPKKFRLHRLLNTVSLLTTWVVFHLSFWKYRNVFNQAKYHTFRINGIFTTTGAFLSSVNQTSGHWRDIHTDAHVELSESWCYIDILDAKACYQKLALMRQNKTSKNRVKRFRYRYWYLILKYFDVGGFFVANAVIYFLHTTYKSRFPAAPSPSLENNIL